MATDLEFVMDQFANNENASDREMIKHLEDQTRLSREQITRLVKKVRPAYFKNPLITIDDGLVMLRKLL